MHRAADSPEPDCALQAGCDRPMGIANALLQYQAVLPTTVLVHANDGPVTGVVQWIAPFLDLSLVPDFPPPRS